MYILILRDKWSDELSYKLYDESEKLESNLEDIGELEIEFCGEVEKLELEQVTTVTKWKIKN